MPTKVDDWNQVEELRSDFVAARSEVIDLKQKLRAYEDAVAELQRYAAELEKQRGADAKPATQRSPANRGWIYHLAVRWIASRVR